MPKVFFIAKFILITVLVYNAIYFSYSIEYFQWYNHHPDGIHFVADILYVNAHLLFIVFIIFLKLKLDFEIQVFDLLRPILYIIIFSMFIIYFNVPNSLKAIFGFILAIIFFLLEVYLLSKVKKGA